MPALPVLTGIGSLPPDEGPLDDTLRRAVETQRACGFRLLPDGEPRADMLGYYASLPGIEMRGGAPRITGRIRPLEDPSSFPKVRDLDFLRRAYPDHSFKVALTAPTTFLMACAAGGGGPAYRGPFDPAMHEDLTESLRPIAREIARRGAHLQLDDPILSQGMRDYSPALRRLDAIAAEVPRERASLHVCGGLARSKALVAMQRLESVSTLSIAFAGRAERENVSLIEAVPWADRGLALGAGAIGVQVSTESEIMPAESVASLLREVSARAGDGVVRYVLPDCGLRGTPRELVPHLLANLQKGFAAVFAAGP